MEWQTPAVSEKYQSRFGCRPGTSDSGDTGIGTSVSDSTEGEDLLSVSLSVMCEILHLHKKRFRPFGWLNIFGEQH